MSSHETLMSRQLAWARTQGLTPDSRGYLGTVDANLWRPLEGESLLAFKAGSGQELAKKMMALHSSSALAVNFFDYWSRTEPAALASALGLNSDIKRIAFEEQFPTGLPGNPPNIDVCIELASGEIVAIESKFSEWLNRKSRAKAPFKPKYFDSGASVWSAQGLVACQRLAEDLRDNKERFEYFDAPQMLKHALGLATNMGQAFSLWYVYYQFKSAEAELHRAEIERFAGRVGDEIRFKHATYQDLFAGMEASGRALDPSYAGYLKSRYFAPA